MARAGAAPQRPGWLDAVGGLLPPGSGAGGSPVLAADGGLDLARAVDKVPRVGARVGARVRVSFFGRRWA